MRWWACAWLVLGCGGCRKASGDARVIALAFDAPHDGDIITRSQDVNAALDGVQRDVLVSVANAVAGDRVTLTIGEAAVTTTVAAGVAAFPSVTLPFGLVTLTASGENNAVSIAVTVLDQGALCDFVTPRDGDVFTAADDKDPVAGFQTDVLVSCVGLPPGTPILVGIAGRRPLSLTLDADGHAGRDAFSLAEGPNTLVLSADLLPIAVKVDVIVDTGRCLVALAPDDGFVFTAQAALDLRVVTSCAVGSVATITVRGTPPPCLTIGDEMVSATVGGDGVAVFSGAPLTQLDNIVNATVIEPDGARTGEALPNYYDVDTNPPVIDFVYPDNGVDLVITDDDLSTPGFQINVHGQAHGVEPGIKQLLQVVDSNQLVAFYETKATVVSGPGCDTALVSAFEWAGVTVADGPALLLYTIVDRVGNQATRMVSIYIDSSTPSLVMTAPVAGFYTLQDDVDAAPGLQLNVVIANANAAGLLGSLLVQGQAPIFFTYSANPQIVPVTLADTVATTLEATVTLQNGRVVHSAQIALGVDGTPPYLRAVQPRDGDVVGASAATADITVALGREAQARDVRLGAATATIAASGPLFYTFAAAPLSPGDNVLTIEADDRTGVKKNTSAVTLHVFRALGPPTIAFTTINGVGASSGMTLSADPDVTNGFDLAVGAHVTAAPGPALVDLFVNGALWLRSTRTVGVNGQLDLSDIDFSLWANDTIVLALQVTEVATGAVSALVPLAVRVDAGASNVKVAITSPPFGAHLKSALLDVAIETELASVCQLRLGAASVTGAVIGVTGTTGLFAGVTLALVEGLNEVSVACNAPSGVTFYSQRQQLVYRASSPALAFVDAPGVRLAAPAGSYYFNALAPDTQPATGYQQDVALQADEPDGTSVSLTVDGGAPLTAVLIAGRALFRDVTLSATSSAPANQVVVLSAQLTDAYGYGLIGVTRNVLLDLVPPTIAFANGTCVPTIGRFNPYDDPHTFDRIEWNAAYLTNASSVTTRVTDYAGTHDFAGALISFAVAVPPAAYGAAFVGIARDAANNTAKTPTCTPTVDPTSPVVSFATQHQELSGPRVIGLADDLDALAPGVQTTVFVTILNLGSGASVHLCSTANDPALALAPACGSVPGKVLAAASSTTVSAGVSQAALNAVNLVDGVYSLAVEVNDISTMRTVITASVPVTVDSVPPPTLAAVTSTGNNPSNDRAATLVLGIVEGDATVAGKLDLGELILTMSGGAGGTTVVLKSSLQGTLTPSVAPSGSVLRLSNLGRLNEGNHAMTLVLQTASHNETTSNFNIFIDVTRPTITVGAPTQAPYTCPVPGSCLAPSGVTTGVDVVVSDNFGLTGGCACARAGPLCAACDPLGASTAELITVSAGLAEGSNAVLGEASDGVGNTAVSAASVLYTVDTVATSVAPALSVGPDCSTFGAACTLVYDQGVSACHDAYPSAGTDPGSGPIPVCARWFSSNTYQVATSGTTSGACQIVGDTCTHDVRLIGTPLGQGTGTAIGLPVDVFLSARAGVAADIGPALLETIGGLPPPGLERATQWKLVLEAKDRYGNFNRSAPRFVTLPNFNGALVAIEKVTGSTGAIANGEAFGVRHNKNGTATPYVTDLKVQLNWTALPPLLSPRCVRLTVNGVDTDLVASTASVISVETIDFPNVTLPDPGTPFTLSASVDATWTCGTSLVGVVDRTGISTTVTLPTVAFDCTWRKALGFNLPGDACSGPGTLAPTGIAQTPLVVGLEDQNPSVNGFQFPQNLKLTVTGAVGGVATLQTNLAASLTGQTSLVVAGTGVTFDATLTVPTSMTAGTPAATDTHTLTALVCNTAGDCAGSGAIQLRANADPPAQVGNATVCSGAASDDAACASLCTPATCDRRAGKAVLSFVAPGANAGTVGTVSGYAVAVGISPSGVCNDVILNGTLRYDHLFVSVANPTLVAPGQTQTLAVSGLPVHQRLCIAALARDDVGNLGAPNAVAHTALLDAVMTGVQSFPDDTPNAMATFAFATPLAAIAVGDMDGDGGVDIAVSGVDSAAPSGPKVLIYSSADTRNGIFTPREVITHPSAFFARQLAGGDFNGDGFADLAISAPVANKPDNTSGGGAVYIYYGTGTSGGALIQRATCAFANVPQPACPHVILYRGPGAFVGYALAAGHITHAIAPNDGRKQTLTFPADLLAGEFQFTATGAVYLVRHGAPFFKNPAPAATEIFDVTAVTGLTTFSATTGNKIGVAMTAADLNGDNLQDIVIGADGSYTSSQHRLYLYDAAGSLPATRALSDAQRCDSMDAGLALNLARIGRISGTAYDWIAARRSTDKLQLLEGGAGFFTGSATCLDPVSRADSTEVYAVAPVGVDSSVPNVTHALLPITAWGASLDDTCNTPRHIRTDAYDVFSTVSGAAAIGDYDGDGRDDFIIGQSGASAPSGANITSRAWVVTYAPPVCAPAESKLRILTQLNGNITRSGPGLIVFGAWSHAGGSHPAIGMSGIQTTGSPNTSALSIYK